MPLIVYTATNKANGKVYVGITMQPLAARMAQHKCRAGHGNRAFPNAIAKYGMDGFDWAVVQECATPEDLHAAERDWIRRLNSLADGGHGYNRTLGGGGTAGFHPSEETRARQSKVRRIRNAARGLGKRRQQTLFNRRIGTKHSPEHVEKIRQSLIGKPSRARKLPIGIEAELLRRYRAGETHTSLARELGVSRPTVSHAIQRADP